MKYIYHIVENGSYIQCEHSNIDDCMNELMKHLFKILGNGDNENGGRGSLWRCSHFIYDTIRSGSIYEYANCKFWVEFIDETKKVQDKRYTLRYSAVVHNSVTVQAKDKEELKRIREYYEKTIIDDLKRSCNGLGSHWHYDGNINDEGEEEIK
jgi:hypothetical protein